MNRDRGNQFKQGQIVSGKCLDWKWACLGVLPVTAICRIFLVRHLAQNKKRERFSLHNLLTIPKYVLQEAMLLGIQKPHEHHKTTSVK